MSNSIKSSSTWCMQLGMEMNSLILNLNGCSYHYVSQHYCAFCLLFKQYYKQSLFYIMVVSLSNCAVLQIRRGERDN